MQRNPATYDLLIYKGSTFQLSLVYEDAEGVPIDLSGYSGVFTMRSVEQYPGTDIVKSSAPGLVLGGALGTINVLLTEAESEALLADTYRYSLKLTDGAGVTFPLLLGRVVASSEAF